MTPIVLKHEQRMNPSTATVKLPTLQPEQKPVPPGGRTRRARLWKNMETHEYLRFTTCPIGAQDNGWVVVEVIIAELDPQ